MLYFAAHHFDTQSGAMLTGSHNPPQYNGIKIVLDGVSLSGEAITALRTRAEAGKLASGAGRYREENIAAQYLERIVGGIKLARPMKIAVDCGNGVAGATLIPLLAPSLLSAAPWKPVASEGSSAWRVARADGETPEAPGSAISARASSAAKA